MDFAEMMALDERAPDSLIGRGPRYPWGGLYGGQIVAQSLRAAAATVESRFVVHSLHAYFIRRGDAEEPIRFDVDRLRDGRNFVTRAVVARQSMGAILHMSASFQIPQRGEYAQVERMPDAPAPDSIKDNSWSRMFDRRFITEDGGRAMAWLRVPGATDDPVLAACAFAYISDDLATDAVRSQRRCTDSSPDALTRSWSSVSLDHAIWFHHTFHGSDWQLHDFRCVGLEATRGLAIGRVFSPDGAHLATVSQEVLHRSDT
jgi:acyl-CoA thioesterase II